MKCPHIHYIVLIAKSFWKGKDYYWACNRTHILILKIAEKKGTGDVLLYAWCVLDLTGLLKMRELQGLVSNMHTNDMYLGIPQTQYFYCVTSTYVSKGFQTFVSYF